MRERVDFEIIPVRAEHSAAPSNNEGKYGARLVIDLDLDTCSETKSGSDGTSWLKVTLDRVHCVEQVMSYWSDGTPLLTWTCTDADCSKCVGDYCNIITLTVSTDKAVSDLSPISDCKYGDTVKLEFRIGELTVSMYELAIAGKPGKL